MRWKWISTYLIPILGMLVILAASFGFEGWKEAATRRVQIEINAGLFRSLLWSEIGFALLLMGALIGLFWWIARGVRSGWMGAVFLVAGLGIVAYPCLYLINGFIDPVVWTIFQKAFYTGSYLNMAGAGVAMVGLLGFVLPRGRRAS